MDLREKKTRRSITNAFLELRTKKPLEKITVKELCEKAEVSKATFYLHYKDIYDLSDVLQNNIIDEIMTFITDPRDMIYDPCKSTDELIRGFYSNRNIINILFSGSQFSKLPEKTEGAIKEILFSKYPELKTNVYANIRITYQLMGSFYSFYKYETEFGVEAVKGCVDEITAMFENREYHIDGEE